MQQRPSSAEADGPCEAVYFGPTRGPSALWRFLHGENRQAAQVEMMHRGGRVHARRDHEQHADQVCRADAAGPGAYCIALIAGRDQNRGTDVVRRGAAAGSGRKPTLQPLHVDPSSYKNWEAATAPWRRAEAPARARGPRGRRRRVTQHRGNAPSIVHVYKQEHAAPGMLRPGTSCSVRRRWRLAQDVLPVDGAAANGVAAAVEWLLWQHIRDRAPVRSSGVMRRRRCHHRRGIDMARRPERAAGSGMIQPRPGGTRAACEHGDQPGRRHG